MLSEKRKMENNVYSYAFIEEGEAYRYTHICLIEKLIH